MNGRRQYSKGRAGFTLMELLVVIAIIAILAAIIFPAVNSALQRAQISKAKADMLAIASAIRAYYETYGIWPTQSSNGFPDNTFGGKAGGSGWKEQSEVMDILRAIDATNNTRRIVFLEVPLDALDSDDAVDGSTYELSDGFYIDPWGNPYYIVMDTDYDNEVGGMKVQNVPNASGINDYIENDLSPKADHTFPGVRVGVMSLGPKPELPEESFMTSW